MANQTENREYHRSIAEQEPYLVNGGSIIYEGSFVQKDAQGYLIPYGGPTATAYPVLLGIAAETVDNTDGADGALWCKVWRTGVVDRDLGTVNSLGIDNVGDTVYAYDDHSLTEAVDDGAGTPLLYSPCGRLVQYGSTCRLDLRPVG